LIFILVELPYTLIGTDAETEDNMLRLFRSTMRAGALVCVTLALSAAMAGCGKSGDDEHNSARNDSPAVAQKNPTSSRALPPRQETVEPIEAETTPKKISSDDFFNQGAIPHFRIDIDQDSLRQLSHDPRTFVRADVQVDDTWYRDVGVHLKGRRGSFRSLGAKPGFSLKFNKFKKGQRFHGLEKIHLNNSVQDPSFMTEIICSQMFREAGVPAARATNARVQLNGRNLGFYVLIEGITEDFLHLYFENTKGNLYDFPYTHDITSSAAKESKDRDRSDLRTLASAARERDFAKRWQSLGRVLDRDRFIDYLALEVMIWDWDCYAMCRNNYRVYHDPGSDKFVFIPHGMDQIFENPHGSILPVMKGIVAQAMLEIPEGRRRYFERMKDLAESEFTSERMMRKVTELQNRIRPVLADLNPNAARRHDQAVGRLRQNIQQRIGSVQQQLTHLPTEPVPSSHFP
jgi:spore coat protein CotH